MKKLLLALGLASLTFASAHAQGTINPLNNALTRVICSDGSPTPEGIRVGVFWGAAGGPAENLAGEMSLGTTAGILVGLPAILAIPGAGEAGTVISLQFRVTNRTLFGYGETAVSQVTLGTAAGPGTQVWNSSNRLILYCPEPSTIALGALGGLMLLFRLRKSSKD